MAEIDKSEGQGLEALAGEINAEHQAFVGSLKKTAEHGIRCGELLTKAKDRCPHGEWLEWLRANFEGSERSAQVYMQMYCNRDEIRAKTQNSADLSISGALKEIAAPEEDELPPDISPREREIMVRARRDFSFDEHYLTGRKPYSDVVLLPNLVHPFNTELDRLGFVAQVAWECLCIQARKYSHLKNCIEESIYYDGRTMTLDDLDDLREMMAKVEWWVGQVEYIERRVRACDWPKAQWGTPKAAFDEELKYKTLAELYDDSEEPGEFAIPSPRGRIQAWLGG